MKEIFRSFGNICDGTSSAQCQSILDRMNERLSNQNVTSGNITDMFNIAYSLAAVVAVVVIVWGGIQYINSGGEPGKVAKAKNTIIYAIAGLIVVLLASVITNIALEAM